MPRDGSGRADNAVDENATPIIHGADQPGSNVDRSGKAAPPPEPEKGEAIEGMNASGGGSQGLAQGPSRGQGGGSIAF
ncbi:hypothetical protein RB595_010397 [Gaeumannomyces hyphopodioides]